MRGARPCGTWPKRRNRLWSDGCRLVTVHVAAKAEIRTFVSSSGFRDGLGERVLTFDRAMGEVRERLRVRPELAAFEAALGAQIDRVSKLTDPRFPRARDVDRDRTTGQVVIVSDYMAGERLSDLLESANEREVFPDIAAALQTAGELLLAMASFSGALKTVHGAIAPSRIVISEKGDVGITDYLFAPILSRLRFSASRLWSDLGIASGPDGASFDEASDARQIALVLIAMALGRPIEPDEYPHKIPSLVAEVCDVALISCGDRLATGLRAWLERALNLERRQGFGNMAHACASFGQLTFDGGGLAGSRAALVAFLTDVSRPPQAVEPPPPPPPVMRIAPRPVAPAPKPLPRIDPIVFATPDPDPILIPESEPILFTVSEPEPEPPDPPPSVWARKPEPLVPARPDREPSPVFTPGPEFAPISDPEPLFTAEPPTSQAFGRDSWLEPPSAAAPAVPSVDTAFETSLSVPAEAAPEPVLERIVAPPAPLEAPPPPVERPMFQALHRERPEPLPAPPPPPAPPSPIETFEPPQSQIPEVAPTSVLERLERLVQKLAAPFPVAPPPPPPPPAVEPPVVPAVAAPYWPDPEPVEVAPPPAPPPYVAPAPPPVVEAVVAPEPSPLAVAPLAPAMVPEPAPAEPPEKKKKKPKKLRLRRQEPDPPTPPPAPAYVPPPPPPPPVGYLLPDIPPPGVSPLPAPASPFPSMAMPDIPPPGVVPLQPPRPIFPTMPGRAAGPPVLAAPPAPPAPIRLKDPASQVITRARKVERNVGFSARSDVSPRPPAMMEMPEWPRLHMWKFAAIIVVIAVAGFAALKFSWSSAVTVQPGMLAVETTPAGSQVFVDGELRGKTPLTIPVDAGKHELKLTRRGLMYSRSVTVEEGKTRVERYAWSRSRTPGRGGLRVSSEPPGANVYVDGRLQGETPLDLPNIAVGTHTVRIESSIGSVRRTVNVVRGEEALVDVELYSGFVKVFAPIELELSVNGRPVGNGSEPIMLPPGEQEILAVNKAMGYREVHTIEVEPGETRTLTITPVGRLTVTAVPWAEVWIDETNMGRTPLTNRGLPIGTHTLVLRHPEHGERRVVATIKHNEVTSVPVDMTKP
jgi:hypothetical protein